MHRQTSTPPRKRPAAGLDLWQAPQPDGMPVQGHARRAGSGGVRQILTLNPSTSLGGNSPRCYSPSGYSPSGYGEAGR